MDNEKEVKDALQRLSSQLSSLFDDASQCKKADVAELRDRYRKLKDEIKMGAKYGKLDHVRGPLTKSEDLFYLPALQKASVSLSAKTNSNPSGWAHCLYDAKLDIDFFLSSLKGH